MDHRNAGDTERAGSDSGPSLAGPSESGWKTADHMAGQRRVDEPVVDKPGQMGNFGNRWLAIFQQSLGVVQSRGPDVLSNRLAGKFAKRSRHVHWMKIY